jgi:hypothetical protein
MSETESTKDEDMTSLIDMDKINPENEAVK